MGITVSGHGHMSLIMRDTDKVQYNLEMGHNTKYVLTSVQNILCN